jgi:hypothetical protein
MSARIQFFVACHSTSNCALPDEHLLFASTASALQIPPWITYRETSITSILFAFHICLTKTSHNA